MKKALPAGAVRQRMTKDGCNATEIDIFFAAEQPAASPPDAFAHLGQQAPPHSYVQQQQPLVYSGNPTVPLPQQHPSAYAHQSQQGYVAPIAAPAPAPAPAPVAYYHTQVMPPAPTPTPASTTAAPVVDERLKSAMEKLTLSKTFLEENPTNVREWTPVSVQAWVAEVFAGCADLPLYMAGLIMRLVARQAQR